MACALLYNFKDAARLQKVRFALFKLGVSGRIVAPEELSQPIGYLCDLEGFSPVEETVEGGFSDEMLVLCGLSGPQLDAVARSQMWALGYRFESCHSDHLSQKNRLKRRFFCVKSLFLDSLGHIPTMVREVKWR